VKLLGIMFVACAFVVAFSSVGPCIQVKDDEGRTILLQEPAKRVISLYGAFSEMLYAIGAGQQLAARTQADHFPPEITNLPSVGTHMRPNVEMILGLKPDLVLQSASRKEAIAEMNRLSEAGIPIAVFAPNSFDGIFSAMERLGILTGHEEEAGNRVCELKKRLAAVRSKLTGVERHYRVFFEVRADPLAGAGRGSMVQEILSMAGAENMLESQKSIVQYGLESLLLGDPDIYIVQRGPMNRNPFDPRKRPHFERMRSVRDGKIIYVDEFMYSRPGPRCVDAVEELAGALYPERFKGDDKK
jgi:iron complex transport system substrate-binding protein